MKRDQNLSNPLSDPAHASLMVTCAVHFDIGSAFPKVKFQQWLASLPEDAKVEFTGISSGKPYFRASWKEER